MLLYINCTSNLIYEPVNSIALNNLKYNVLMNKYRKALNIGLIPGKFHTSYGAFFWLFIMFYILHFPYSIAFLVIKILFYMSFFTTIPVFIFSLAEVFLFFLSIYYVVDFLTQYVKIIEINRKIAEYLEREEINKLTETEQENIELWYKKKQKKLLYSIYITYIPICLVALGKIFFIYSLSYALLSFICAISIVFFLTLFRLLFYAMFSFFLFERTEELERLTFYSNTIFSEEL